MADLDLAVTQDVSQYLVNGPFASSDVVSLSGGFGNYAYRLKLRDEYHGRKTLVLKHGKAYIPGATSMAFDLARQNFEQTVMRQVRSLLPEDSLVTVPEVHLYDENAHVIIMDDCGEDAVSLKDLLKSGVPLPLDTIRKIGTALGTFLTRLHNWGEGDQEALDFFDRNKQARVLSAWATYGRLVSTLSGEDTYLTALTDPPLECTQDELELVAKIAQETTDVVHSSRETLLMGDFWPGNVLLSLKQSDEKVDVERIFIIDWELVKPGLRGMDIGQFCAEMHQMRRFFPATEPAVLALVSEFLGTYREMSKIELTRVARIALTHVGAHLIAWTPRSGWEGKETIRQVVAEGVQCLVDGYQGKPEKVDNSIVGRLTMSA
ncbi:hypothetical protein NM688_g5494 [Phlebia brevispora]|uniref:Uncharacterized protein n=1 Tax=Phlebia brevispora TaxID=194682 RepID=A0ACC1SU86_9APHY|nr:hypothetical protein NM688_g5494 [Phlebia brevispora]